MSKNSDAIARNALYAARKEKVNAVLANIAEPFTQWNIIRDFIEYRMLFSVDKDNTQLPELLKSGYVEIVEPDPCEKHYRLTYPTRTTLLCNRLKKALPHIIGLQNMTRNAVKKRRSIYKAKKDAFIQISKKPGNVVRF